MMMMRCAAGFVLCPLSWKQEEGEEEKGDE
jgi:hypothetical protein